MGSAAEIRTAVQAPARANLRVTLAAILAYWFLLAAAQYMEGARNDPFAGYPDEPAHYISGLLVRDYAFSGFHNTPLAFAANYYIHIPFLGIGYWPPLFYGIEGTWMMAFGTSRFSVLLLIALISAAAATTCFRVLAPWFGLTGAFIVSLLLFLLPATQWSVFLVMTDTTLGLFFLWFCLAFARWADQPSVPRAIQAGLILTCALFTKFTAVILLGAPILFFLITRTWFLMRKTSFWVMVLVVFAFWGPWILKTHQLLGIGYVDLVQQKFFSRLVGFSGSVLRNLSWLAVPAALGIAYILTRARMNYRLLLCVIVPFCYSAFLLAAGIGWEDRFLLPVLTPLIVPIGVGLSLIMNGIAKRFTFPGAPTAIPALCVAAFAITVGIHHRPLPNPVRPVVEFMEGFGDAADNSVLVPTPHEGPFIAEFALREKRPERLLVRPTKLLASENWGGGSYQAKFAGEAQMTDLFDRFPVRFIIMAREGTATESPHDAVLRAMLRHQPERWTRLDMPAAASPALWEVYRRTDGRGLSPDQMLALASQVLGPRLRSVGAAP